MFSDSSQDRVLPTTGLPTTWVSLPTRGSVCLLGGFASCRLPVGTSNDGHCSGRYATY